MQRLSQAYLQLGADCCRLRMGSREPALRGLVSTGAEGDLAARRSARVRAETREPTLVGSVPEKQFEFQITAESAVDVASPSANVVLVGHRQLSSVTFEWRSRTACVSQPALARTSYSRVTAERAIVTAPKPPGAAFPQKSPHTVWSTARCARPQRQFLRDSPIAALRGVCGAAGGTQRAIH